MSSTFSSLKFELIATGEESGAWGATTNSNIGTAIEQAIVGMATLTSGSFTANVATLTLTNTNAAQTARALCLVVDAGALSAAGTINVPAIQKPYLIINNSSFAVTVKVSGLTGVSVPAGKRTVVYNNGTDVGNQVDYLSTLALGSALPVTSGGTGVTTSTGTGNVVLSTSPTITSPALVTPALGTPTSGILTSCTFPTLNQNTTGTAAGLSATLAVTSGGTGQTTYTDGQLLIGNTSGNTLTKAALTAGTGISITNGNGSISIAATNAGTVTSVTGTSPVASTGGATPAISLSAGYGDTLNPYASKTANYFLAAPNGSAAAPTFRAIVAADIPTLNQSTSGTAAGLSTTLALGSGGTGQTTAQLAMNALAAAVTSGSYLRGNGSNVVMSTIQAADVPTLNQNTSGSAASLSATLAVSSGGTGQTTYTDGQLLIGNTTGNTLTKATLTAGSNITITNSAGGITIASSNPGGTVTSVTATSPVASSGGTTPVISMAAASASVNGYLTSTDWSTFNGKQAAGSYVTVDGALGTPSSGNLASCTFPTLNQNTSGNAATATTLQTARTIGGVSFNGSANIDLAGVNTAGNQNTSGSSGSVVTTGFSIIESGGKLVFKYGATVIASMDSSGNFTSLANMTAYGTP